MERSRAYNMRTRVGRVTSGGKREPRKRGVAERVGFEHLLAVAKSLDVARIEPETRGQDGGTTSDKTQIVYELRKSVYRFRCSHVPNCIRAEAARYTTSQDRSQVGDEQGL